jgi:signal transduction histidine kinase
MSRRLLCLLAVACAGPAIAVLHDRGDASLAGPSIAAQGLVIVAGLSLVATLDPWLAGAGAAWLAAEWASPAAPNALLFGAGLAATGLTLPLLVRPPLVAGLAGAGALLLGPLGEDPGAGGCSSCPLDLFPALGLQDAGAWLQIGSAVAFIAILARATVRSTPAGRRRSLPLALATAAFAAATAAGLVVTLRAGVAAPAVRSTHLVAAGALVAVGLAAQLKPLRLRRARQAVTRASTAVAATDDAALSAILAPVVGDPALRMLYAVPGIGWTDAAGRPAELPAHATAIEEDGASIAAVIHAEQPDRELLDSALAAGRLRLDAERLRAAVLARVEALRHARRQVVSASEDERRTLERDLHDGAQQRLVALRFALGLTMARADEGEVSTHLARADGALERALAELRELAHGLYPPVLDTDGLATAIPALAERSRQPVEIVSLPDRRFPPDVERAAYRIVADALSAGGRASIEVGDRDAMLRVHVRHDGRAGTPAEDVIHALGGTLRITPSAIDVALPCA